jgi:transposase
MRIMYAIRDTDSESEIYELLNMYIGAAQFDGAPCQPCARTTRARIRSTDDLMQQIRALLDALGAASRRLDDHSRLLIKEVLYVFCTAAEHLASLHRAEQPVRASHADAVHRVTASVALAEGSQARGKNSDAVSCSSGLAILPREGAAQFRNL